MNIRNLLNGEQKVTNLDEASIVIEYCKAEKGCQSAILSFAAASQMFKVFDSLTAQGYTCQIMDNEPPEFYTLEVLWDVQHSEATKAILNSITQLKEEVNNNLQEMIKLLKKVK